jgi:hypothetical protein
MKRRFIAAISYTLFAALFALQADAAMGEITVRLGEQFTLGKKQVARIAKTDVTLRITRLAYSPCPKGAVCVWSGKAADYELLRDDTILHHDYPYGVTLVSTDYKTYAVFIVRDSVNHCLNMQDQARNQCWERVAVQSEEKEFCGRVGDRKGTESCYRAVTRALRLNKVISDIYDGAVDASEPDACIKIPDARLIRQCYRDIAKRTGKGSELCESLRAGSPSVCRDELSRTGR